MVLGVAKELEYRPSHGARAMASGRVKSAVAAINSVGREAFRLL
jgi:DNA-binding LacI/PurR family transcriptional regulator